MDDEEEFRPFAYVDGSYNVYTKTFGAGATIKLKKDDSFHEIKEGHKSTEDKWTVWAKMRNVAGEILASIRATQYAIENKSKTLDIYFDYKGISAWVSEEWQARNDCTRAYRDYMRSVKDKITINFIKVTAHSGNELNDVADKLAKEAVKESQDVASRLGYD